MRWVIVAALMVVACDAGATVIDSKTMEEIYETAEVIAVVRVVRSGFVWDSEPVTPTEPPKYQPATLSVEAAIEESLRGAAPQSIITFRLLQPQRPIKSGDRFIVFLEQTKEGYRIPGGTPSFVPIVNGETEFSFSWRAGQSLHVRSLPADQVVAFMKRILEREPAARMPDWIRTEFDATFE